MSTDPKPVTKPAAWTAWENQVVNGVFPLRRFLGTSRQGVVFMTEYRAEPNATACDAVIKLVPADASRGEAQLAQWEAAAAVPHPHLVRLFESGRCQLGGRGFVFLIMEYAEQTLAQILARRALGADEAREMVAPALSALACLHRNQLVHGQLKPSNILAVDDRLKLSSDSVRAVGRAASGLARTSLYDPPELREGTISAAGDMWALGMTLVEALTQRTWAGSRGQLETTTSLLASLPAPFSETARRCLSRAPADRPTAAELEAQFQPVSHAEPASQAEAEPHSEGVRLDEAEPLHEAARHEAEPLDEAAPHGEAMPLDEAARQREAVPLDEAASQDEVIADEVLSAPPSPRVEAPRAGGHLTSADASLASEPPDASGAQAADDERDAGESQAASGVQDASNVQSASEAPGESSAPQGLSLASLSIRAIAGAFLLFLGAWAILRS